MSTNHTLQTTRTPGHERCRRTRDAAEGRMSTPEESTKDGANIAGATGPVEDAEPKTRPGDTPGRHRSPADEQPADQMPDDPGSDVAARRHDPDAVRGEDEP